MSLLLSRREVLSIIDEANYKNWTVDQVLRRRASRWRLWSKNFRPERLCLTTTTDKINYGTSTAITITLNSLSSSSTVGRQATVIDNGTNLFDDALVTVIITTGTVSSSTGVNTYLSGSEDGTNYDQDSAVMGASDAGYTIDSPTSLALMGIHPAGTSSKVYNKTMPVALLKGGIMPRKWTIVVTNTTGGALAGSGNSATYTGITYTNS